MEHMTKAWNAAAQGWLHGSARAMQPGVFTR
jgi:hypothetical protein